jgi:23S rRNA pseudouridine1911/1915/1917 synthase
LRLLPEEKREIIGMMQKPEIIYQDDALMVLEKPAGWIVNEAVTITNQPTVQDWLRRNFKFKISDSKLYRSGIVHRIDKETSGILIVAKTKEAFMALQMQFKERKVKKRYIALVHGKMEQKEGEIDAPVGRLPWNRERFGVLPGGREAMTRYKVIRYWDARSGKFSLLELAPLTGRTHQIRIHLKFIGHPIVGDIFYAGRKTARDDRKWCPRLFLHASYIEFTHPRNEERVEYRSGLPVDLKGVLNNLPRED